jgi:hypothetical protein
MVDLKEVFKQAAEIAQQVPENMQEAAFNRALDLLTNKSRERHPTRASSQTRRSQNKNVNSLSSGHGNPAAKPAASESSKKSRKSASGFAPKSAILWLLESGFFSTGKTGPAVQDYLKKKRGYDLETDKLRMVMLRLVREGVLEREENQDGQYQYKQTSSRD